MDASLVCWLSEGEGQAPLHLSFSLLASYAAAFPNLVTLWQHFPDLASRDPGLAGSLTQAHSCGHYSLCTWYREREVPERDPPVTWGQSWPHNHPSGTFPERLNVFTSLFPKTLEATIN